MALSKTSSSSSSAATSPPPSSSYASSSTAVQLILATSCNDVFVDPKQILDEGDAANAPDPTKCLSSWESPMASKAGLVVANIRLVVPLGAKIPDKIAQLQLTILCNEVMTFPSGPFESNQPFKDKIIIDAATDHPISPGNLYVWDVPLLIPWNAAAYERGRLGRNYWHITAKMTFPGRLFMSKTLSAQKNLFVINAPMNHSALSYQHIHTGVADGLGALQLSFISNLFTTGGYLRGALLLPSPSPTVKIHGISMTMIQTVTLQSRRRHRHFEKCPEDRFEFFSLRGSDMENAITHCGALCRARPAVGQEIELEWVARLPKDEKARCAASQTKRRRKSADHFALSIAIAGQRRFPEATHIFASRITSNCPSCTTSTRTIPFEISEETSSTSGTVSPGPSISLAVRSSLPAGCCQNTLHKTRTPYPQGAETSGMVRRSTRRKTIAIAAEPLQKSSLPRLPPIILPMTSCEKV